MDLGRVSAGYFARRPVHPMGNRSVEVKSLLGSLMPKGSAFAFLPVFCTTFIPDELLPRRCFRALDFVRESGEALYPIAIGTLRPVCERRTNIFQKPGSIFAPRQQICAPSRHLIPLALFMKMALIYVVVERVTTARLLREWPAIDSDRAALSRKATGASGAVGGACGRGRI